MSLLTLTTLGQTPHYHINDSTHEVTIWYDTVKNIQPIEEHFKCPICGSEKLYNQGNDEYYLVCYGEGYWEKGYYPPSVYHKVNICGNCGAIFLKK